MHNCRQNVSIREVYKSFSDSHWYVSERLDVGVVCTFRRLRSLVASAVHGTLQYDFAISLF